MNIACILDDNISRVGEYKQFTYCRRDGQEVSLSNVQIRDRACALAAGLKKCGIKKGDVVGVVASNIAEIPEIMNGIMRSGATYLPIIFALMPSEIRYVVENARPKILLIEEKFWDKVKQAVDGVACVEHIVVIGDVKDEQVVSYAEFTSGQTTQEEIQSVGEEDLAILMYTSGTTGTPKGVMLSHANLLASMKAGCEVWPCETTDVGLVTIPMNHIYGVLLFHESCLNCFSLVMIDWFDADRVLSLITKKKISIVPLVPTMITMMMEQFDPAQHSMETVRRMVSAGAPLAEETLVRAMKMFQVPIVHGYGLTEAGPTVARQRLDRPLKYGSVGPAVSGVEVRLLDDLGAEVPVGGAGEIIARGPGVMRGYWNKPIETAAALKDGWLYTGDLGRFDEDGELYIVGRKKDLIIRGAENIDPGVSEGWLYKHPEVLEAAVIGIPDPKYGEEVAAAVALRPGSEVSEEDLLEFVRAHVHRFMAPKKIFFMDSLPKSPTGKLLKREIKECLPT